ncbi:ATP-dependent DNA helicase RecG [Sphingobium xanthum]|uniref:ATP-dependent DNA helicase RecG n=1 Tax=Sphingobium xanthum TaxID=1387165 RepID=UPI001C8CF066|nr:ATP-dependent DNA helicase RecG [Sphingobium xanthum]
MRPDILNPLFTESSALKGVGAAVVKPLERLGLTRAVDLAFHLPVSWIERQRVRRLVEAETGRMVGLVLTAHDYRSSGSARAPFRVRAVDEAGDPVSIVYFGKNSGWPRKLFPIGEPRFVSGRLDQFGDDLQIVHPDHVVELGEAGAIPDREPVYGLSEGITNGRMRELVAQGVARAPELPEWIEPGLKQRKSWPDWRPALAAAHEDPGAKSARERLAFDEIFASQLALMLLRASTRRRRGNPIAGDGHLRDQLKLPFAPTGAQRRAFAEIEGDMAQSIPMLRLLQGDVGSGKTLVALMALLNAVEAGGQGAFLAPTEILARQHFASLREMLAGLPVNIALLTGRDKGKARESTLMGLADGSIHILVGTHAIFQDAVAYRNLALAIIDEQHRFGVSQRLMLTAKAERTPHLLVMTATPIPRTLTLTQYGDMDVSRLDEMPPGRQPVDTRVISDARLEEVIEGLGRHIGGGRQAYWVCPLVEQGEAEDEAAAEARAAILRNRFGAEMVGVVHGRMPGPEKDAVMEAFASGRLKLLVATTVIEVGVNVPNATLMVVEAAERFGLAQLHQLRGRVGRGDQRSFCMLLHGQNLSETARSRLALMRETNDGFRIAEEDLRLRGAGEILGTRQSGEQRFRIATPEQIQDLLGAAHDDARLLMDRDGGLDSERGQAARTCLYLFERDAAIALLASG